MAWPRSVLGLNHVVAVALSVLSVIRRERCKASAEEWISRGEGEAEGSIQFCSTLVRLSAPLLCRLNRPELAFSSTHISHRWSSRITESVCSAGIIQIQIQIEAEIQRRMINNSFEFSCKDQKPQRPQKKYKEKLLKDQELQVTSLSSMKIMNIFNTSTDETFSWKYHNMISVFLESLYKVACTLS